MPHPTRPDAEGSRLVYSTDGGRVAGPADKPGRTQSRPPAREPLPPDDGVVRIFREKGGRGGKTVTVIRGLPQRSAALARLTQDLKRLCGAGGTAREDAIEIQGDHRERLAERLRSMGYQVKLAGG